MLVLGVDMALANMGLVLMHWDGTTRPDALELLDMAVIRTEPLKGVQVRKSADEVRRARELHRALHTWALRAQVAAVEVPSGSQSAQAARALGIAVGVLAACPIPMLEVSPMEVKRAVAGPAKQSKPPSKAEVIQWAVQRWPSALWPRKNPAGPVLQWAEHIADACAAVEAGIATNALQLMRLNHETPGPAAGGPALDGQSTRPLSVATGATGQGRARVRVRADAGHPG